MIKMFYNFTYIFLSYIFNFINVSATMPLDVLEVTTKFMRDPVRILVKKDELTLEGIRQFYIAIEQVQILY